MRIANAFLGLAVAVAASAAGLDARAQGRGDRPLEGVNQAVVLQPEIGSSPANAECGVTPALVADAVIGPVIQSGLRTERVEVAAPFTVTTPGVYLVPRVATLREGNYMCISWVGLRAVSVQPVTLPATGLSKMAEILHWEGGYLLSTDRSRHAEAVSTAIQRLAGEFGTQWRQDQR